MSLRLAGDYNLKRLVISNETSSQDLSQMMIGLEIFEDIYAPGITGNIHINDAIDLYENMPIIGGETVDIEFTSDLDGNTLPKDYDFKKKFFVTGIVNIEDGQNDHVKTYTIEFASKIYFENNLTKISKAYDGNVADIVESLFKTMNLEDDIELERTIYSENFVVPRWTPIRTINYLAKHSLSLDNKDPSFFFYEDKDGFKFVSLSHLFKKGSSRTLTLKNNWIEGRSLESDPHVISSLNINQTPDLLAGMSSGVYGGTIHNVDILNKRFHSSSISYEDLFSNDTHLNKNPIPKWKESSDYNHRIFSRNSLGKNANDFRIKRISKMNQINSYILTCKVPNYTRQKIGDVITLDIQSPARLAEIQGTEVPNETLSGNYLIRSIRHIIAQGGYDMIMEISKESL